MRAEGWHRDPFALHENRWFSEGRPTRLVRDQGAESYDEPPTDEPRTAPGAPAHEDQGQLARARLLYSRIDWAASRNPPRNWRYWTVLPPCLLTLALSCLAIIFGSISLSAKPSGAGLTASVGAGSLVGWVLLDLAGLVVAGVAAVVILFAAADRQVSRRACALAGWVIAGLAYGWVVLIPFLSSLAQSTLAR
jgi:hypothetical protein